MGRLIAAVLGIFFSGLALAQNPMPRDPAAEYWYTDGTLMALVVFFVLVGLFFAKSSPLHDWADEHTTAAALAVIFVPAITGIVLG